MAARRNRDDARGRAKDPPFSYGSRDAAESRARIPDLRRLGEILEEASETLNTLDPPIRPGKSSGEPGGLLRLPPDLPVLVVPDLHAREKLLRRALDWLPPGEGRPLSELAAEGRAVLLLLGDLFHSEGPDAPIRWEEAYREYLSGFLSQKAMDEEMGLGLGTLEVLAQAMVRAPGSVLCLKGNHDNSRNREGFGDHGFCKFADEGAMCASWLEAFTDSAFRGRLAAFEESLPLAAAGGNFAASHAEPAFPLTERELIDGEPETVEALTWTANGQALPSAVSECLRELLGAAAVENGARWVSGHRPVEGRYALRAEGLLVQIHAPFAFQGAWIRADRPFRPESDILEL